MRASQPSIESQQCGVERLGESDVERVPTPDRVAQIPGAIDDPSMTEPLAGPLAQVGNCLPGGGRVEVSPKMLSTDHPENLDVNHMRRRMVGVPRETVGDLPGARGICHHLEQT